MLVVVRGCDQVLAFDRQVGVMMDESWESTVVKGMMGKTSGKRVSSSSMEGASGSRIPVHSWKLTRAMRVARRPAGE